MASTILMNGALLRPNTGTTATANQTFKNDGVANSYKQNKLGIGPKYRFGPSDFRGYIEAVRTADVNGVTNTVSYATATHPFQLWTMDAGAPNLQPPTLGNSPWNGEIAFATVLWNGYANQFWAVAHGGNNSPNKRQIFLLTSSNWNGPWAVANSGNPIIPFGTTGTFTENGIADPIVKLRVTNGVPTLYLFHRGFNASNKCTLGFTKTTDVTTGTTGWATPVQILQPVAATWESSEVYGIDGFEDEDGRFHAWYIGTNGTTAQVGYIYSDDWTTASTPTFTRGANNPVRSGTGVAADPDNAIGDDCQVNPEEDLVAIETEGANFTGSYTPNPLDGRAIFWHPRLRSASYVYTRKGRHFTGQSNWQTVAGPSGVYSRNSNIFSIYLEVKCPPGNVNRMLYYEEGGAFNKTTQVYLSTTGLPLGFMQTTTTGALTSNGSTRADDDQWHYVCFRRTAAGAFDCFLDGVSQGTSAANPTTDSGAVTPYIGGVPTGNSQSIGAPGAPALGTIRRCLVVTGYALTAADQAALWNSGSGSGAYAGSGTRVLDWYGDADHLASPLTMTVTGAALVEAQPLGSLTFPNYTVVAATNRAMERLGKASLTSPHLWRGAR